VTSLTDVTSPCHSLSVVPSVKLRERMCRVRLYLLKASPLNARSSPSSALTSSAYAYEIRRTASSFSMVAGALLRSANRQRERFTLSRNRIFLRPVPSREPATPAGTVIWLLSDIVSDIIARKSHRRSSLLSVACVTSRLKPNVCCRVRCIA